MKARLISIPRIILIVSFVFLIFNLIGCKKFEEPEVTETQESSIVETQEGSSTEAQESSIAETQETTTSTLDETSEIIGSTLSVDVHVKKIQYHVEELTDSYVLIDTSNRIYYTIKDFTSDFTKKDLLAIAEAIHDKDNLMATISFVLSGDIMKYDNEIYAIATLIKIKLTEAPPEMATEEEMTNEEEKSLYKAGKTSKL